MLEHELLLNCARTKLNPEIAQRIQDTLKKPLNWNYVIEQAQYHHIGPLLYNSLKNYPVPVPILKTLEKTYTFTGFHNMLYLEELNKILEEFHKQKIRIIVLKGPALAQNVYDNIALRPFIDMDLLVKKENLNRIDPLLNKVGYITKDKEFYYKYHFHIPYTKTGKINIHLELHWAFVDRFILNRINMDRLFRKIDQAELPPELNILYLLLHIEKHAFFNKVIYKEENPGEWIFTNPGGNQLIWYTDLYELISSNSINWQKVIETAKDWAIQHIAHYNLHILRNLYPLPQLDSVILNLPYSGPGFFKKAIYKTALRRKKTFKLQPEMQLRPIRAVDLINYLFPSLQVLLSYYCISKKFFVIIYYPIHFSIASKEIFSVFIGICRKKLYTNKKKEFPSVD